MAKPKLAVVPPAAAIWDLQAEVYTIQALADGARSLIQSFYESHDNDPETDVMRTAMLILDVADERLDDLGTRVESFEAREVARG